MDAEQTRTFLLTLPHVEEAMQWGANLVYRVGDKALGGKMFALIHLEEEKPGKPAPVFAFYAGPERYAELLEDEMFMPAPYFARAYWVALKQWRGMGLARMEPLLQQAHTGVLDRIPARTREALALSRTARAKLIAERKGLLATKQKQPGKAPLKRSG